MPTYDFRCPAGHDFERFYRKISDAPMATACPDCGQDAARRMSAGAGLVFKGSGFYITDYGKDGKKDQRAAASSNGAKSESKGEGKAASSKPEPAASKPASGGE